jgi:cobalt-zinc-cadmium efflux system membrane fusion protein
MKIILVVSALLFAGGLQAANLIPVDPAQREALGIRSGEVQAVSGAWGSPYPAKVRVPNAQLRVVSAPQEGLLTTLLVAEGEPVRAGQSLAVIRSPQLVEQQGSYLEALTRLELARVELARDRKLKADGIIAERRFLETRARHTQAGTEVDRRRQALLLAGMDADSLDELVKGRRLSSTLAVHAPLDGVVLEQMATPGQRLEVATPLYRVGKLDPLWLEIHVPLERLGATAPGTRVRVDKPRVEGRVITIGSMVHGEDQGVLIRAEISAGAAALRPGQFVEARIAAGGTARAFRIPRNALLRQEGWTWVLLEVEGGFQPLEVELRNEEQESLVIEAPLQAGARVAVAGTAALKAAWLEGAE